MFIRRGNISLRSSSNWRSRQGRTHHCNLRWRRLLVNDLLLSYFQDQAFFVGCLYATDNFCFYPECLACPDQLTGGIGMGEDFQPVSHIEDLVHFPVVGTGSLLYELENGRRSEQIILYDPEIARQVFHALGLSAAAAMDKPMDGVELFGQQLFQQGRI